MSLNELPKQNWVEITKEQIRSIPVGSPIRVGGTETILSYHYKAPSDYGFDTKHVVQDLGGSTFGSFDWNKNIKVEVLMNQGHPHAVQMLQYAQDAMTTTEPWKLWQYLDLNNKWTDMERNPQWGTGEKYRRRPITKLIHGVEVPALNVEPYNGCWYYYPDPTYSIMYSERRVENLLPVDVFRAENGLCYTYDKQGKEAAILHAKAMLGKVYA